MRFVPVSTPSNLTLCLAPYDEAAREFMATRRDAEPIEVEVLNERDMFEHRRIFAQIADVAKALHRDPENVRAELLFETGNCQVIGQMFGSTIVAINSMSRHAMKDHELHAFWEEAKEVIKRKLLPNVSDAAERSRLAAMLSR